jgi:hypothetical protein
MEKNNLKSLKNKYYQKTLKWKDLNLIGINERTEDHVPFLERWAVTHGQLPAYTCDTFVLLLTDAKWESPYAAMEYFFFNKKGMFRKIKEISEGFLKIKGEKSEEEARIILSNLIKNNYTIVERYYCEALTIEERIDLKEEGINDDRSNVTFFYFSKL